MTFERRPTSRPPLAARPGSVRSWALQASSLRWRTLVRVLWVAAAADFDTALALGRVARDWCRWLGGFWLFCMWRGPGTELNGLATRPGSVRSWALQASGGGRKHACFGAPRLPISTRLWVGACRARLAWCFVRACRRGNSE
eukprot:scaffold20106_cov28-Tisochrysis_lutea.AAC.2